MKIYVLGWLGAIKLYPYHVPGSVFIVFMEPYRKEHIMHNKNYISVGIDVGSAFSFMTILAPDETVILKPFKITHNNKDSLERAVSEIKKAEELYSLESRIFLESTGIYHFPLFCYLVDCGFNASIINPIITHSTKNGNIRKVKNDKIDSKGIAKLGLSKDIPVSQFPAKLVLELRSLTRKYYDLTDERSAHINKLKGDLHTVFPQYLDVFCDVTGKTSTMILRQYGTPDKILRGHKKTMIEKISKADSLKYFLSRPKGSQLGAWVSRQSETISSRALLEQKFDEMKRKFLNKEIPIPSFWGGYILKPIRIEFWQGGEDRLHDRFLYEIQENGNWTISRLAP